MPEPASDSPGPLQGTELRVFRSLLVKRQANTLGGIQTELSAKPEPAATEIEQTLEILIAKGYVEEVESGRWRISESGYAIRWALIGDEFHRA